jgi:hypothetical protein
LTLPSDARPRPGSASGKDSPEVSNELFGTLINVAGRQRMLSQRIVLHATLAWLGHEGGLQTARTALSAFESSHKSLARGDAKLPGAFFPEIRDVYFGQAAIDARIRHFIDVAHKALHAIERDPKGAEPSLRELVADSEPVLEGLILATRIFEEESKRRAAALRKRLNDMMDNIKGIATQARIVSFNAQVIAARAGEGGREFSAVASVLADVTTEMNELVKAALTIADQ